MAFSKYFSKKQKFCIHFQWYENHYKITTFKTSSKHFLTYTKHKAFQNELEIKSLWITTDEKGANTFPFHNLPPKLKKILKSSFMFFSPFPLLDKIKDGGDSCFRDISRTSFKTVSSRSEERRVGKECRSRWSPYH